MQTPQEVRLPELNATSFVRWPVLAALVTSILIGLMSETESGNILEKGLMILISASAILMVERKEKSNSVPIYVMSVFSILLAVALVAMSGGPYSSTGTMAFLSVFISGSAIMLLSETRGVRLVGRALLGFAFSATYLLIVSSLYGAPFFAAVGALNEQLTLSSIYYFLLVSAAMLTGTTAAGVRDILVSPTEGGMLARRLIPLSMLLPIPLGWLRIAYQKPPSYDSLAGIAILVTVMAVALAFVIVWTASRIGEFEEENENLTDLLNRSEERFRGIIENTDDGFISMNSEGVISEWNQQSADLFGYNREDVVGRRFSDIMFPEDTREGLEKELVEKCESLAGHSRSFEFQGVHRDGHGVPVETSIIPVALSEGLLTCFFIRDVSKRQEYERALARARDQAIRASEEKARFLASMSHEIRTPLNAVIGLSDLLRRSKLSRDGRQMVEVIVNSGNILLDLINNILDYSKLEAGKLELEFVEFSCLDVIEETAEILATKARDKELSLMTHVDPEIPDTVSGDPGRIRQILMNLVDNAIKFTDEGEVVVRAQSVRCSNGQVLVNFSVSDTGSGIAPELHDKLFIPFEQVGAQISRMHGGTGLGLSISKRLVEMMGGDIGAESTVGVGSHFWFNVPFEECRSSRGDTRLPNLQDLRMLIIDSPRESSRILKDYAESWGIHCDIVCGWGEASDKMTSEAVYDLIFVDHQVPENDWISVSELKRRETTSATKFILLSSSNEDAVSEEAMKNGYSACLRRPIKQSQLYDCIASVSNNESQVSENGSEDSGLFTVLTKPLTDSGLVLVVEDNPVNQKVALLQLRELGLSAHAVGNGVEALAATEATNYELILMDCQMPELDGYDTTRQIRKRETLSGSRTTIIAMTANAMPGDREKCLAAGMDDYIAKPVTQAKLQAITDKWMDKSLVDTVQMHKVELVSTAQEEVTEQPLGKPPIEVELLDRTYGETGRREILESFFEEMEKLLSSLTRHIENGERFAVQDVFHQIKGMASSIYAVELSRLAWKIENAASESDSMESKDWAKVQTLIDRFKDKFQEVSRYVADKSDNGNKSGSNDIESRPAD